MHVYGNSSEKFNALSRRHGSLDVRPNKIRGHCSPLFKHFVSLNMCMKGAPEKPVAVA